jgi:hypothetical protein
MHSNRLRRKNTKEKRKKRNNLALKKNQRIYLAMIVDRNLKKNCLWKLGG